MPHLKLKVQDYDIKPITIFFLPLRNLKIKEQECKDYVNNFVRELENEIEIIICENQDFYKKFNFSFCGEFTSFGLFRDNIDTEKLIVYEATMHMNFKIK